MADEDDDRLARAPQPEDVVRICGALNESGARYLLIGGFAVIAHGAGRFTKDIDLLIDDAPENVARVKQAPAVLPDNAAASESLERDGVTIPIASPATLIRLKDTPRPQDAIDKAFLEEVIRSREEAG